VTTDRFGLTLAWDALPEDASEDEIVALFLAMTAEDERMTKDTKEKASKIFANTQNAE